MVSLHQLISRSSEYTTAWSNMCYIILQQVLIPNVAWRMGKEESSLRFEACACLLTMLQQGIVTADVISSIGHSLIAVMKTTLDDYDSPIRLIATQIMTEYLPLQGPLQDEEDTRSLYRKLLKRLDDNDDQVRIDVCKALTLFVHHCLSPELDHADHFGYIVSSAIIHLDDPNEEVKV
jgi:hypothetical protein